MHCQTVRLSFTLKYLLLTCFHCHHTLTHFYLLPDYLVCVSIIFTALCSACLIQPHLWTAPSLPDTFLDNFLCFDFLPSHHLTPEYFFYPCKKWVKRLVFASSSNHVTICISCTCHIGIFTTSFITRWHYMCWLSRVKRCSDGATTKTVTDFKKGCINEPTRYFKVDLRKMSSCVSLSGQRRLSRYIQMQHNIWGFAESSSSNILLAIHLCVRLGSE